MLLGSRSTWTDCFGYMFTCSVSVVAQKFSSSILIWWSLLIWQILLQYYNSSLEEDETTKKIVKFGAVACISGGIKANFSLSAPKVMYYSARGPDPEDSSVDDADILKPNLVAPGNSVWAAWSSHGAESIEFQGSPYQKN